jgi:hypothetical protein
MFTYAMAETVLARLHAASEDAQRAAFRARLKHLKRLGIPSGINPGRGKRVSYAGEQIFEWAFCLELAEFGIDPTVVVEIIRGYWLSDILPRFLDAHQEPEGNDLYFGLYPKFMARSWDRDDPMPFVFRFVRDRDSRNKPEMSVWLTRQRRVILINVSKLVRQIAAEVMKLGDDSREPKTAPLPTGKRGNRRADQ